MNPEKLLAGVLAVGLIAPAMTYGQTDESYSVDEAGYGVSTLENRVARLEKRLSASQLQELPGEIERETGGGE